MSQPSPDLSSAVGNRSTSTVSYLAPASLAAAREQVESRVSVFLSQGDLAQNPVVVRLGGGDPESELAAIDGENLTCVVADFVLWKPAWKPEHFTQLSQALLPDGVIVFIEPTATYGWRRHVHRRTQSMMRQRLGYDFEKDVPAELRRGGVRLTTVDRFELGRTESYVWGQAQHFPEITE